MTRGKGSDDLGGESFINHSRVRTLTMTDEKSDGECPNQVRMSCRPLINFREFANGNSTAYTHRITQQSCPMGV